jgi:Mn-dependent DtxR family transcriptional regulator
MVCALHRDKDVYCDVCYDGFSYGEKYTYNLLKQLGIKVKRHKYFEWSRNVYSNIESLCGSKEYDFYIKINNEEIILETNGLQHYEECKFTRRTLYEETENDKLKQELAISKGIKENNYIIIDCRYSDPNYIKDNMLSNENLRNKFDLSRIDWDECEKHANSKYFLEALKYYNSGTGHMEIADIMEIDFKTVKRYLKRASEHGLCDFKTIPEIRIENKLKAIELWNNGIHNTSEIAKQLNLDNTVICDYLSEAEKDGEVEYKKYIRNCSNKIIRNVEYNKEFISINQAHTASKDIFGIDLSRKGITKSCDTGQAYKGLHFEYIDKNNIHI